MFRAPVGGLFRHVRDLVRAQNEAGHCTGIVCDSTTGSELDEGLLAALAPTLALGLWRIPMQRQIGLSDLAAAWRAFRIIGPLAPDVLHGHGAKGGLHARLVGTLLRRRGAQRPARIYTPHGGSVHYDRGSVAGRLVLAAERLAERLGDHILFVSEFEAESWAARIGAPRCAATVVRNGLQPEEFVPVEVAADAADCLFIGEFRDLKGPDLFLAALQRAGATLGRPVSAIMIGAGERLEACRREAARMRLPVQFLPPMPARKALRLGRILVAPSRAESLPYIVLEALAASRPVIATRIGGIPEIFAGHAHVLCAPESAALAARISEAIADPHGFSERLPAAGGIARRFSAGTMAKRVEKAYG